MFVEDDICSGFVAERDFDEYLTTTTVTDVVGANRADTRSTKGS